MKNKAIILLIGYFVLVIIQACDRNFSCEGGEFFDFTGVTLTAKNSNIEAGDSLHLEINSQNLYFMAENHCNFQLISNSYALSCDDGWAGAKFPFTKIEITSDFNFNENYPANSLLNDIVIVDLCTDDDAYPCYNELLNLSEIDLKFFMSKRNGYFANIYIKERPTSGAEHKFRIKLYKENGDVLTAESGNVIWEQEELLSK